MSKLFLLARFCFVSTIYGGAFCRCAITFWPATPQQNDCSGSIASTNVANICARKEAQIPAVFDSTIAAPNDRRCVIMNQDCDSATLFHATNGVCSGSNTILREDVCNTIPNAGPVRLSNCKGVEACSGAIRLVAPSLALVIMALATVLLL